MSKITVKAAKTGTKTARYSLSDANPESRGAKWLRDKFVVAAVKSASECVTADEFTLTVYGASLVEIGLVTAEQVAAVVEVYVAEPVVATVEAECRPAVVEAAPEVAQPFERLELAIVQTEEQWLRDHGALLAAEAAGLDTTGMSADEARELVAVLAESDSHLEHLRQTKLDLAIRLTKKQVRRMSEEQLVDVAGQIEVYDRGMSCPKMVKVICEELGLV